VARGRARPVALAPCRTGQARIPWLSDPVEPPSSVSQLTGSHGSIRTALPHAGRHPRGGSILWVVGELTCGSSPGIVLYHWMQYEEREAVRADRRADTAAATARRRAVTAASPAHNGSPVLHRICDLLWSVASPPRHRPDERRGSGGDPDMHSWNNPDMTSMPSWAEVGPARRTTFLLRAPSATSSRARSGVPPYGPPGRSCGRWARSSGRCRRLPPGHRLIRTRPRPGSSVGWRPR